MLDRHLCLNLYPCVIKKKFSLSLSLSLSLPRSLSLSLSLLASVSPSVPSPALHTYQVHTTRDYNIHFMFFCFSYHICTIYFVLFFLLLLVTGDRKVANGFFGFGASNTSTVVYCLFREHNLSSLLWDFPYLCLD